jgi:hypothetical protein
MCAPWKETNVVTKVNEKVLLWYCIFVNTVKPVYNGHTWVSKKVAGVQKWPSFGGWFLKITINIGKLRITLKTGGRCSEVVINIGLTVLVIYL